MPKPELSNANVKKSGSSNSHRRPLGRARAENDRKVWVRHREDYGRRALARRTPRDRGCELGPRSRFGAIQSPYPAVAGIGSILPWSRNAYSAAPHSWPRTLYPIGGTPVSSTNPIEHPACARGNLAGPTMPLANETALNARLSGLRSGPRRRFRSGPFLSCGWIKTPRSHPLSCRPPRQKARWHWQSRHRGYRSDADPEPRESG